jgi:hypothetical protein
MLHHIICFLSLVWVAILLTACFEESKYNKIVKTVDLLALNATCNFDVQTSRIIIAPLNGCSCVEELLDSIALNYQNINFKYVYTSRRRSDFFAYLKNRRECYIVDSSGILGNTNLLSAYPLLLNPSDHSVTEFSSPDIPGLFKVKED